MWLFALVFALPGCGTKNTGGPKTVPVRVTVLHDGVPVKGASVTFISANSRGAVGNTDNQGQVQMWTFKPGDGVIPGAYDVTIRKLEVLSLPNPETVSPEEYTRLSNELNRSLAQPPKHLIPKRYSSADTSELTADVKDGGENNFTFKLSDE